MCKYQNKLIEMNSPVHVRATSKSKMEMELNMSAKSTPQIGHANPVQKHAMRPQKK